MPYRLALSEKSHMSLEVSIYTVERRRVSFVSLLRHSAERSSTVRAIVVQVRPVPGRICSVPLAIVVGGGR